MPSIGPPCPPAKVAATRAGLRHPEHPEEAAGAVGEAAGEEGGEAAAMTPLSTPIRRALELLATSPDYGWTVSFLAANDVSGELIFNLIRQGLAVAKTEGVPPVEVTYIMITDTGRSSLGQR